MSLLEAFYFDAPSDKIENSINLIDQGDAYDIWSYRRVCTKEQNYHTEKRDEEMYEPIILKNHYFTPSPLSYRIAQSDDITEAVALKMLKKGTCAANLLIALANQYETKLLKIPALPDNFHTNTLLCILEEKYLNNKYLNEYYINNLISNSIKFLTNQKFVLALQQLEKAFPQSNPLIYRWRKKI